MIIFLGPVVDKCLSSVWPWAWCYFSNGQKTQFYILISWLANALIGFVTSRSCWLFFWAVFPSRTLCNQSQNGVIRLFSIPWYKKHDHIVKFPWEILSFWILWWKEIWSVVIRYVALSNSFDWEFFVKNVFKNI